SESIHGLDVGIPSDAVDDRDGERDLIGRGADPLRDQPLLEDRKRLRVVLRTEHGAFELGHAVSKNTAEGHYSIGEAEGRIGDDCANRAGAKFDAAHAPVAFERAPPEPGPNADEAAAGVSAALFEDDVDAGIAEKLGDVRCLAAQVPTSGPKG